MFMTIHSLFGKSQRLSNNFNNKRNNIVLLLDGDVFISFQKYQAAKLRFVFLYIYI